MRFLGEWFPPYVAVARTPYQRLLDGGALTPTAARPLADRYQSLNPVTLRRTIEEILTSLWKCADRFLRQPPQVR